MLKKTIAVIFLSLAAFFCVKDLVTSSGSLASFSFIIDFSEEESTEGNEKNDTCEKTDIEKWHQHPVNRMICMDIHHAIEFRHHKEKKHYCPYFEVYSPPPESV